MKLMGLIRKYGEAQRALQDVVMRLNDYPDHEPYWEALAEYSERYFAAARAMLKKMEWRFSKEETKP